jgi:hypothetical protein
MTNKAIARGFVARLSQTNEAEAVKELAALVILNKKTKVCNLLSKKSEMN